MIDAERSRVIADVVRMVTDRRSGHLCSSLSVLDILRALLMPDPAFRDFDDGHLILSKGHAAPALYAVLMAAGRLDRALVTSLRRIDSPLEGHPRRGAVPTVEVSTGSLGHGLAFAVGLALGEQIAGERRPIVAVCSDAELQTGIAMESLAIAGHYRLAALTVIVDDNGWQTDGPLRHVASVRVRERVSSLGFQAISTDGHDVASIRAALSSTLETVGPVCIIAATVRCHGLQLAAWAGAEIYGEQISDDLARELRAATSFDE